MPRWRWLPTRSRSSLALRASSPVDRPTPCVSFRSAAFAGSWWLSQRTFAGEEEENEYRAKTNGTRKALTFCSVCSWFSVTSSTLYLDCGSQGGLATGIELNAIFGLISDKRKRKKNENDNPNSQTYCQQTLLSAHSPRQCKLNQTRRQLQAMLSVLLHSRPALVTKLPDDLKFAHRCDLFVGFRRF